MKERVRLAECILYHRHLLGETQETFAEGCGLSVEIISLIERASTNPTLGYIVKISDHIGVSLSDMFKFETTYILK